MKKDILGEFISHKLHCLQCEKKSHVLLNWCLVDNKLHEIKKATVIMKDTIISCSDFDLNIA